MFAKTLRSNVQMAPSQTAASPARPKVTAATDMSRMTQILSGGLGLCGIMLGTGATLVGLTVADAGTLKAIASTPAGAGVLIDMVAQRLAAAQSSISLAQTVMFTGSVSLIAMAAAVPTLVRRLITNPIKELASALATADGMQTAPLPYIDRTDGLGDLARAVDRHMSNQARTLRLDATLQDLKTFATAVREMTHMFKRGQTDLAQHIDAASTRILAATDTVLDGEGRIASTIASIEDVGRRVIRIATDTEGQLRRGADVMSSAANDFARSATQTAKAQADEVTSALARTGEKLRASGEAVMESASRLTFDLDIALKSQTSQTRAMMQQAEAKLRETTAALNSTTGDLIEGLGSVTRSQAENARQMMPVIERIEAAGQTMDSHLTRLGETEARIGEAVMQLGRDGGIIGDQVTQLVTSSANMETAIERLAMTATSVETERTTTRDIHDRFETLIGEMTQTAAWMQGLSDRSAAGRTETLTDIIMRIDGVAEAVNSLDVRLCYEANAEPAVPTVITDRFDRLASQLNDTLANIGQLSEKVTDLQENEARRQSAFGSRSASDLPLFNAEKASFQRILVGFNLLMRNIGEESARLRETIAGIAGIKAAENLAAADAGHLEELLGGLKQITVELGAKVQVIAAPTLQQSIEPIHQRALDDLPSVYAQKDSLQRLLVGFRLLMREIGSETEHFRSAVEGISRSNAISPTDGIEILTSLESRIEILGAGTAEAIAALEARLVAPIAATADRIRDDVNHSLAAIEARLDAPIGALTDCVTESANVLREVKAVMSAGGFAAIGHSTTQMSKETTLSQAVAVIERASDNLEAKLGSVDDGLAKLVSRLNSGLDGTCDKAEIEALARQLEQAGAEMRGQTGEFLAIGAALSKELDDAALRSLPTLTTDKLKSRAATRSIFR
jgi:hypothetical protein